MASLTPWHRLATRPAEPSARAEVRTICVIGAGPSGLVAAKHLRDVGYTVTVLERSSKVGGTFVHKAYDDARLVSSKYLTAFSDLRSPTTAADHMSLPEYVAYLEEYCDRQELWSLMRFGTEVLRVTRETVNGALVYNVETRASEAYPADAGGAAQAGEGRTRTAQFDAVCVCSGLHEVPYTPAIAGADSFDGVSLHSCEYKERSLFKGRRVLVLGCGETGMDLAYRAVHTAAATAISVKRGFLAVPYEGWGGVPLDTLIANLFEHCHEHWLLHALHVKWAVTTVFIRAGFWLTTGSSAGWDQWVGHVEQVKRGHHILCKSTAALPFMNRPAKRKTWRHRLWSWLDPPHKRVDKDILTFPAPAKIEGRRVTFVDGTTFEADVLVYATGYCQRFPFLEPVSCPPPAAGGAGEAGGWRGGSGARGEEDPLPSEHFIVSAEEPTLAFLGFVRPNVGAIPPMSELQVLWWIEKLRGRIAAGHAPPSYGLLGKKLVYGVDYGNYMH
mmetsp:Transcript_7477/g.24465  ORF Transcript_7477/g.24465 Transcript_7477/m.24465 type:complete len:501 (+) Transcript_7477:34-1536(+)